MNRIQIVLRCGWIVLMLAGGCGGTADRDGSGGSGGGGSCDAKTLTCGQVISAAELTTILGQAPTYDAADQPNCNIGLTGATGGGVQVFCGSDYASMLSGAKGSYPATTEPNTIGQRSFELNQTDLVEVGFLTTSGRYAVLVNLITTAADIGKARALAQQVDENLSAL
jgi:hypothetical protein